MNRCGGDIMLANAESRIACPKAPRLTVCTMMVCMRPTREDIPDSTMNVHATAVTNSERRDGEASPTTELDIALDSRGERARSCTEPHARPRQRWRGAILAVAPECFNLRTRSLLFLLHL